MSVSCLDLTYSITYKISKVIKDESKDETELVALDIPIEELADEEDGKFQVRSSISCKLIVLDLYNHDNCREA